MDLTFTNRDLARLCNEQAALATWAGDDALALQQLLNELDCVETLGLVEEFPHVLLLRAPAGRVAASGVDEAGVLLEPESKSKSYRAAEAAVILAIAVGDEEFNPEGAEWPRASAMSRTTR